MIILAFPGLGKTTATFRQKGLVDLDFDYFRAGFSGVEMTQESLRNAYVRVAIRYSTEGFTVLVNEPWAFRLLPNVVDFVALPKGNRVYDRCAKKLGVTKTEFWDYYLDWKVFAARFNIPTWEVTSYLSDLPRFLLGTKSATEGAEYSRKRK